MMRFDHGRLGLPAELPGTGAIAKALIDAGAAASYGLIRTHNQRRKINKLTRDSMNRAVGR
jgi:hypothetical protein